MEWVRGDTIGHGNFATVSLAKPIKQNSLFPPLMAVKSCGASHSALLENEKLILEELRDCPEVIHCYGDSFSLENGEKLYNVLLEYAPGGTLAEKVKNSGDCNLPEFEVRSYTKSILKGLLRIHRIGYVHCDVKLQNVLVCEDGAIKIADFGLAKKAGVKGEGLKCDIRGTPLYMSPETVVGGEQESAADIWALGCVMSEMVTGAPAWRCRQGFGENIGALLMRIGVGEETPEIPAKLSNEGKDFLGKCFLKNPRQRWTAEMLLNHPFVAGHDDHESTVLLKDDDQVPSASPRCHFDFPDWNSSCEITPLSSPEYAPEFEQSWAMVKSPASRLLELMSDLKPDWSVSSSWITVRCRDCSSQ